MRDRRVRASGMNCRRGRACSSPALTAWRGVTTDRPARSAACFVPSTCEIFLAACGLRLVPIAALAAGGLLEAGRRAGPFDTFTWPTPPITPRFPAARSPPAKSPPA